MTLHPNTIAAILLLAGAAVGVAHARGAPSASLTRGDVTAQYQKARAAGQLHRTDWDDELASRAPAGSVQTRQDVAAQLAAAQRARRALPGPLANRNYNPYGAEILKPTVALRADVKHDVLAARGDHTLQPAGEAIAPIGRAGVLRAALSAAY